MKVMRAHYHDIFVRFGVKIWVCRIGPLDRFHFGPEFFL